jgi:hypothetical protein
MLQHQSHSCLTQCARSILRKLAAAQPGSDEYQPEHAPTHSCAKLRADVQLQVAKPFFSQKINRPDYGAEQSNLALS